MPLLPLWRGEIFRTCPDRPGGLPSLLYNGYTVFIGGKAAGAWLWPPTPSSADVKERVDLYLYSPSGPSWPLIGWTLITSLYRNYYTGRIRGAYTHRHPILYTFLGWNKLNYPYLLWLIQPRWSTWGDPCKRALTVWRLTTHIWVVPHR